MTLYKISRIESLPSSIHPTCSRTNSSWEPRILQLAYTQHTGSPSLTLPVTVSVEGRETWPAPVGTFNFPSYFHLPHFYESTPLPNTSLTVSRLQYLARRQDTIYAYSPSNIKSTNPILSTGAAPLSSFRRANSNRISVQTYLTHRHNHHG